MLPTEQFNILLSVCLISSVKVCPSKIYCNFWLFTYTADYLYRLIFAIMRKIFHRFRAALADNLHPKIKENCQLTQSSSIAFVDMISLSMQLINFHTSCFQCFIENDTSCKNLLSKEIDISRSMSWRNRLNCFLNQTKKQAEKLTR